MESKDYILQFLKEWLSWASGKNPEDNPSFSRSAGLCVNLEFWQTQQHIPYEVNIDIPVDFDELLPNYSFYPFGREDYEIRAFDNTQHECPARLAWVKNTITQLEK